MTHLIVAVHGYPEDNDCFIQWLKGKDYEGGGMWNVMPRKIELYDLVMKKGIRDRVASDISYFGRPQPMINLISWLTRIVSKVVNVDGRKFKPIGNKDFKPTKREDLGLCKVDGRDWWVYAYILGEMEDHEKDGKEKV